MKKLLFLAFIGFLFFGCQSGTTQKNHIVLNDTKPLKTFFSPKDKSIKTDDNSSTLLFFFTTTCGACKEAIPYLNSLHVKYPNIQIVGILGESRGFDKDLNLLEKYKIDFKVISDIKSVDYFSKAVGGIYGVPIFYFYDKDGKQTDRLLGLVPQNTLENSIKKTI
ncbi:MAG: TlpA family protein disulfide reductase [Campylobacteraceae bacterium]